MYFDRHRAGTLTAAFLAGLACDCLRAEGASRGSDEAAVRQRAKDYLDAIESGDGDEIASFWTAEGDYVDETGRAVNGRRLARQAASKTAVARTPECWIVEAESVLPDGSRSTGKNLYSPDGSDAFVWEATNVEINGEPMPGRSVRMVRQKVNEWR